MRNRYKKSTVDEFKILLFVIGTFWTIEIIDYLFGRGELDQLGIIPHKLVGLRGVLLAPFLHASFSHLIINSIPFLILGWLTMIQKRSHFYIVSFFSMIIGGLGIWLFGVSSAEHIGASILIYGYLGFLLLRGLFQKNRPSLLLSLTVFFLYGGLLWGSSLWGILPSAMNISWEGHLCSFIAGGLVASAIAKKQQKTKSYTSYIEASLEAQNLHPEKALRP